MSEHIFETDACDGGIAVLTGKDFMIGPVEVECQEIVRCRDCKHGCVDGTKCRLHVIGAWDEQQERDVIHLLPVEPDGFCWKGERG